MNTLYFFKADRVREKRTETSQIVLLVTALTEAEAAVAGLLRIAEFCRADYKDNVSVEPVCQTPDTVEGFEPT